MLLFEAEPSGSVLQLILAERRSILKLWLMTMDSAIKKLLPSQHKRKGLLKHQLHLVKRKDCDRYEIAPIPDPLSFDKGFFLFIRACQLLTQQMEGVVLVGLAGPSGAGKTVFTEKVSNFMPGIAIICMDNYNVASRVIDENYDDPRIIDYDTLLENINDLRAGKPANVPIYDYKTSSRIGFRCVEEPSSRVVIIEGIYALSEKLRPLLDLRVSVTGGVHFDLVKRVLRDINRSGQAPEDIIHQISETVYPMYKAFIEPDLETAHIKIVNKFNPFSGFQNPTYILKSTKSVTEDQIRAALMPDHTETTEETYDMYLLPPAEDLETCQSYLRMRNRDGKYSLMFEEWVTDGPFIISPRITFEVSVRLLGGLMALGYEIATLLKRTSHVFSDEKLVIKIDSLEQLQRKYVQVQGKDRSLVADAGKKLGLQGSYIPRSYIEQIQLEKLTAEVTAIPEELMTKLSLTDNMILSPLPSPSPSLQRRYSRSQSWHLNTDISTSLPNHEPITRQPRKKISKPPPLHIGNLRDEHGADSPAFFQGEQGSVRNISEQLAAVNEKLDELVSRLGELEKRLPSGSLPRQNSVLFGASTGPSVGSFGSNGAYANGPISTTANGPISLATSSLEYPLGEEIKLLSRGQCHINSQLDVLTNLLRENLRIPNQQKKVERRIWDGPIRNMKTTDSGLAIAAVLIAVGLSSAIVIARTFKPR